MPLQATSGAASYDAFGGGAAAVPQYIEDVFSTYLYDGNSSTQTIINGIDLSTKGGLVWAKSRNTATSHLLVDTVRGFNSELFSNLTSGANTSGSDYTSWNTNGYSLGFISGNENVSGRSFVSWTFRKQPKFFDIVTYTGNDTPRTIAHNLGSVPGCIIFKRINNISDWAVYHRGLNNGISPQDYYVTLNNISTQSTSSWFGNTAPTSTVFSVGDGGATNQSGATYVAYLFAHDAGGFGLTGTDNVISCGSFTPSAGGSATVTLGYEPQWILVKATGTTGNWTLIDTMRNYSLGGNPSGTNQYLRANTSGAELEAGTGNPTATGFFIDGVVAASQPHIYIAIRRGPMKVPTSGTSVFTPATRTGNGAITSLTAAGFPPDLYWAKSTAAVRDHAIFDRLRGPLPLLSSNNTQNEIAYSDDLKSFDMTGVTTGTDGSTNAYNQNGVAYVNWYMRRAPSFFDEVCYSGNSAQTAYNHNLGVAPELVIVKVRNVSGESWPVWCIYGTQQNSWATILDGTNPYQNRGANLWGTDPVAAPSMSSTTFRLGNNDAVNVSGNTYVAYLFATAAGVSKCFSYTGNGSSQTINCGFTGGARFVLIKRTDSTGDWYVWDSARGIVSGNDPHLSLNTTAAEVTTDDTIDTDSTGFVVNQVSATNVNVSSATYIGIAIA